MAVYSEADAESLHVEPGYEPAIAAALGSLADAVLVEDRDAAYRALEHAERDELGRVALTLAEPGAVPRATTAIVGLTAAPEVVTALPRSGNRKPARMAPLTPALAKLPRPVH